MKIEPRESCQNIQTSITGLPLNVTHVKVGLEMPRALHLVATAWVRGINLIRIVGAAYSSMGARRV